MFRKKRKAGSEPSEPSADDAPTEATAETADDRASAGPGFDRSEGPWDVTEVPDSDEVVRVDFGSIQVPGVDGMSISLEADEASGQFVAVTVGLEEGAVQLQAFASPRSGGFWDEVRAEIAKGISGSGGVVDDEVGPLGSQLRANVPATTPEGQNVLQSVRFVGVEGPRWLLRGVMLGAAAGDPRLSELFEDVFRGCVVVRGQQPMAPGDLVPLRLPPDLEAAMAEGEGIDDDGSDGEQVPPSPFERGPEITEIH